MPDLLDKLNKQQLEAVTHVGEPLLIVAGAGTGKTTVITRRIAYLMEKKLAKPQEILALTFTEKAAGEMLERVEQLLPLGGYDLWISTFHSFCERILQQHALDIGIPNDFKLLDEVQQWILIYKNFDQFKLDYYRPAGNPSKFIDALVKHFSKCKDEMITPEDYLEYAQKLHLGMDNPDALIPVDDEQTSEIKRIQEIAGAFHTYQKLLLDNDYLDFGDLINYAMRLFQDRPNILKHYQQQFKFVMVDEFQDTNYAQYQLVKMLTQNVILSGAKDLKKDSSPAAQNDIKKANLVVVGDDDQSIYKFRGASVSNILKLKEDFPMVKEVTLVENYRSSQNILDLAYNFIQANNPNRLEPKLNISKKLHSNIKEKGTIQVLEGKDLSEELDLVIKKIVELKTKNQNSAWNDFAVLIRANSAAEPLLPRLEAAGITYSFLANRGLYRKRLIYDLISYMKLLDNYHESTALFRVMQLPKFAISPRDMAAITQMAHKKSWSLYESLSNARSIPELDPGSVKRIEQLMTLLHQHAEAAKNKTAVEVFVTIVGDLGLPELLEPDTLQNAQDRELLDQFYKRIEIFEEQNEDKTLRNFINNLNLEMMAGSEGPIKFDPELGPESLKILTVHSAKGLEYKFVFVINLVEQRFPTRSLGEQIKIPEPLIKDILPEGDFHLQEERRLFYVAMTRAKTDLYLSWGHDYGGAKPKRPSLFLQETGLIPSDKVSKATGKVVFTRPAGKKQVVYQQLPTRFSFSEIYTFKNCPLEYKYRYYLKLPVPGTASLSFGRSVHKALYLFAQRYQTQLQNSQQALFGNKKADTIPDFKTLHDIYAEHWLDEWYPSKQDRETSWKLGEKMLKVFYDDLASTKPNMKYLEESFHLNLGKYHFLGRLDRADAVDRGLAIIDYKTGQSKDKHAKDEIDQLRVYQWAAQEFWQEPVTKLEYWYLRDDKRVPVELASTEQLKALQDELLETIEEIRDAVKYDKFSELHKHTKTRHRCDFGDLL